MPKQLRALLALLTLPTVVAVFGLALLWIGLDMLDPAAPWVVVGAILVLLGVAGAMR